MNGGKGETGMGKGTSISTGASRLERSRPALSRLSLFPFPRSLFPLCLLLACNRPNPDTVSLPDEARARRGDDAPVMVNPESPVEYPPALYTRGIEGNVLLRLYADSAGNLFPDSTVLAESSGYPALDTAALEAVGQFHFAPALRGGTPVAASFLQPIHFRHSPAGGTTP